MIRSRLSTVTSYLYYLISGISMLWAMILWSAPATTQQSIPTLADVQRFATAINQIKHYYINDVSNQELFEHAIRGMLTGLDPHSAYLNIEDFKSLYDSTEGKFGGLGIEVTMEDGVIKVISPIDDTPASRAGIKPGDLIIRINQHPVEGMSLKDAIHMMRGKDGSQVTLLVIRKNKPQPLTFKLTRSKIHIQSVHSELLNEDVGYIRISHFQADTAKQFLNHIATINAQSSDHITGLILDLRNNPGGLLDAAIEVSDTMIHNNQIGPEELIVYTKGRLPNSEFQAVATPGDKLHGVPIVVLINEGSASASEIVAGALKDNKRAILVGTQSFGKGSVQTILPLDKQRGIKLTTALYYTPSGKSIQAKGLRPDITIKNLHIKPTHTISDQDTLQLYEAHLRGHLMERKKSHTSPITKTTTTHQRLQHDYQLHEAYNILKAMRLVTSYQPS